MDMLHKSHFFFSCRQSSLVDQFDEAGGVDWWVGFSENCIFHDRNYTECFSIPLYIMNGGKLKKIEKMRF